MRKLILLTTLFLVFACSKEESGNSTKEFQPGVYGTQEWTIVNASHTTYRDGTPIPQVSNKSEWKSMKTGAWCYIDDDPSKEKLYNWYAIMGIHDRDANTPNKVFAIDGYHLPSYEEWDTFFEFLTENGFENSNEKGKALASNSGWEFNEYDGTVGNDQETNNITGFNALPVGKRNNAGDYVRKGMETNFFSLNENDSRPFFVRLDYNNGILQSVGNYENTGLSVRFIKD